MAKAVKRACQPNKAKVEIYFCKNGKRNVWTYAFATGLTERIKLQSVGCTLNLKDIYREVTFKEQGV